MLHAAAEEENRDDVDWFADVQNDFMGLKLMPKVCERLLQCLSSSTCNLISMFNLLQCLSSKNLLQCLSGEHVVRSRPS